MLGKWYRYQNLLIVIASYIFYAWWNCSFLLILLTLTFSTYVCGFYLAKHSESWKLRKLACLSNVSLCLIFLGIFKYFNFFAESFEDFFNLLGFRIDRIVSHLLLPIGISFYTFKCISYTIDVYKKEYLPSNDLIAFSAYICFFPQLMAGPIDRASKLLSQFQGKRVFNEFLASDGCRQMLWGFFKKVVIADNCRIVVDQIFGGRLMESGYVLAIVAILYSIQLYCDFSGYSDIAIGCSKLFGIKLTQNFKNPYFSCCVIDFWRRWHISLMSWLRDYIYIPLGGSRCSKLKLHRNIVVVWLLSGLWHGANWTFVCWGLYHASLLIFFYYFRFTKSRILNIIFTFLLVTIGWVFFRAYNVSQAICYISNVFNNSWAINQLFENLGGLNLRILLPSILFLFTLEYYNRNYEHGFSLERFKYIASHRIIRYILYASFATFIIAFEGDQSEFIYFRF